jgi:serine/threonine protein kinase/ActR/RegA family two-component response regulator
LLPRYEYLGPLGHGGAGHVFKAVDRELDVVIAIKVLTRANPVVSDEALMRFKSEVILNWKISHPNVCRLHNYGIAGDWSYLTMEFVEGRDLRTVIELESPIPAPRSLRILTQLTRAVAAAHAAGIVHRDLKPANVMIRPSDDVSILDFGLAHDTNRTDPRITGVGSAVGTPQYMAPEQLCGLIGDERSDIYAIGAIAFELLTGRVLFTGRTFFSVARKHLEAPMSRGALEEQGVSRELAAVVVRCLAKNPEERFLTADALAASLAALERQQTPWPHAAMTAVSVAARKKTAVHRRSAILPSAAIALPKLPRNRAVAGAGSVDTRAETAAVGAVKGAGTVDTSVVTEAATTSGRRPVVLVVDDEEQVRNFVCTCLRRGGFEAVPSSSGENALSLLETLTVDLIIIDVVMPGLDGFDTVRVLKSRPEQAQIPVLFISGLPEKNRVLFAGQMGAVDFLPKPLNVKSMLGKVTAILGKPV